MARTSPMGLRGSRAQGLMCYARNQSLLRHRGTLKISRISLNSGVEMLIIIPCKVVMSVKLGSFDLLVS